MTSRRVRIEAQLKRKKRMRLILAGFVTVAIVVFVIGLCSPSANQSLLAGGFAILGAALVVGNWYSESIDDEIMRGDVSDDDDDD